MAKVSFIKPYQQASYYSISPPLGVTYLSSALKSHGHQASLLDLRLHPKGGLSLALKWVEEQAPDILGLSAFSSEAGATHELVRAIKARFPRMPVVVGGPYPSTAPERAMQDENIDFCLIGEGEESFPRLVEHILENGSDAGGLPSVCHRDNGETVINPVAEPISELDRLPVPDWGLLDMDSYYKRTRHQLFYMHRNYMPILTSRGCPYQCLYCHNIFGKRFRPYSVERALEEINMLYNRFGVRELHINDDIFNLDLKRAKGIARGIIDSGMDISISFPNAVRADRMDIELIELLKEAGTFKIAYAVETASPRLQKLLKRDLDLEKTREVIEATDGLGLFQTGFFMLGFPTETEGEMQETINYALESRLHTAGFFVVSVYEGTGLAELASSMGKDIDFDSYEREYWKASLQVSEVEPRRLEKMIKSSYRKFYLDPRRMLRLFRVLPNKKQVPKSALVFLNFAFFR